MSLTSTHTLLLRSALGLSHYTTVPTRNWLPQMDAAKHPEEVGQLVELGYLSRRTIAGQTLEEVIEITDAGRGVILKETP